MTALLAIKPVPLSVTVAPTSPLVGANVVSARCAGVGAGVGFCAGVVAGVGVVAGLGAGVGDDVGGAGDGEGAPKPPAKCAARIICNSQDII